jgi:hypothetical protein
LGSTFFNHTAGARTGISRAYVHYDYDSREELPLQLSASGGLISNVSDMSRLLRWILQPGGMAPAAGDSLVHLMLSDQKPDGAIDISFKGGWSWVLEEHPEPFQGYFAYQMGTTLHFNSVIALAPDHGMGVIILCNTAGVLQPVIDLARRILFLAVEMQTGQAVPLFTEPDLHAVAFPSEAQAEETRGDFLTESYLLQIFAVRDNVIVKVDDNAYQVQFHEDGWFALNPVFRFQVRPFVNTRVLLVEQNGFAFPAGTDIRRAYMPRDDIFARLGAYQVSKVDPSNEAVVYEKLELILEGNILKLRTYIGDYQKRIFGFESNTYNLIPQADGNAIFAGFGMYKGETVFFGQNQKGYKITFAGMEFLKPFVEP